MSFVKLNDLANHLGNRGQPIILLSGGFDPIHSGHLNYIGSARHRWPNSDLVVVVNGDSFLIRKKGYYVLPLEERAAVVKSIRGVTITVPYESERDDISEVIRIIKPHFFCNGGDRSNPAAWSQDEVQACEEVGCLIVSGLGGSLKANSSSTLFEQAHRRYLTRS